MINDKDSLEIFQEKFSDVLQYMSNKIEPRDSKDIMNHRKGIGRLMDIAILLRKGFGQSWQFISILQALFIFLGLAENVSKSIELVTGIYIDPFWIGVIAFGSIVFMVLFGLGMLLYGGSQRSQFLINQKQNPAQRMDYTYYKEMAKKNLEMEKKIDKIKEMLEEKD